MEAAGGRPDDDSASRRRRRGLRRARPARERPVRQNQGWRLVLRSWVWEGIEFWGLLGREGPDGLF